MTDEFIENIKLSFISRIKRIINETKESAERDNLDAIDTLLLVNDNISTWISSINGVFRVDDELLTSIANLKKPFVGEAKKEIAEKISEIIENEPTDVTAKISSLMEELKKKGIDLDGDGKNNSRRNKPTTKSATREEVKQEASEAEAGKTYLRRMNNKPRRNTSSDCAPDSCGGSTGCC